MSGDRFFETHCAVCLRELARNHQCPPRVLRALQAAETRAKNEDDPEVLPSGDDGVRLRTQIRVTHTEHDTIQT